MTESSNEQAPAAAGASPLVEALDQNKTATEQVKQAADDLAVVHAVLDTKVAGGADDEDVKRAVAHTSEVEQRLDASVKKLEKVNETLERVVRQTPESSSESSNTD